MNIITSSKELEEFCRSLAVADFIAIDTEFFRETTYYPQLCLIQIASNKREVIIDALSRNIDLTILNETLQNPEIVKVFHSPKQDLEILYLINKQLPKNIFDTQIAASFCGLGDSTSYEALVVEILGKQIDKSYRISDWRQRPLSEEQVKYALGDVIYLRQIYPVLLEKLKNNGRLSWAMEEMQELNNAKNFIVDVDQSWNKIKTLRGIKVNILLKKLAAWREIKAQEFNLPRNHYLNENIIFKLVEKMPITIDELRKINYFNNVDNATAAEIIAVIQSALAQQIENDLSDKDVVDKNYERNLAMLPLLKSLLERKAKEYNLSSRLIAVNQDLKNICSSYPNENIRSLKGWRYEIFGKFALEIRNEKPNGHLSSLSE